MKNMTKRKSLMRGGAIFLALGASFAAGLAVAKTITKEPVLTLLSEQNWMPIMKEGELPALAAIDGDPTKGAYFGYLKLPANFTSPPHAHTHDYWAVLVQGKMTHWAANGGSEASAKKLNVGDLTHMPGKLEHISKCYPGAECIMAMVQKGKSDFIPGKAAPVAKPAAPAAPGAAAATPKAAAPPLAPVKPAK